MSSLNLDRLRVFVSSTIRECAAERDAVRSAIRSINHEPILFEDIGARPHPPREVYEARLGDSQIFIGIYRESYGWIAPDMAVSGVEDEFQLATDRAMDRLIYIYDTPTSREPRLQALIDNVKNSGITVASYRDVTRLRDRVRDDLTAVISNRFVEQVVVSQDAPTPEEVLNSLVPNATHRIRRPDVERALIDRLNDCGRIVVNAPFGAGKTIILAQISAEHGWLFVDGEGLDRLDLLARAVNGFRERLSLSPLTVTTEISAVRELQRCWDRLPQVPLVVDGAPEPLVFWEIPVLDRKLIVSSRSALGVPLNQRFELPRLSDDEIVTWVTVMQGRRPNSSKISGLVARSDGSPLYLRFLALREGNTDDDSLQELEIHAFQSLLPRAREITSYLALTPRPLSLGDLCVLVDTHEGPETVMEHVANASGLLRQIRGQVMLVHAHLRATILDQLRQTPIRLAYFGNRLGQLFENSNRHLAAFHVYLGADEQLSADRVLEDAVNQAVLMGGGAPAIPVFLRQAELARERGARGTQFHALLGLAFAFKQTGSRADADRAINQARAVAEEIAEPVYLIRLREMEALLGIGEGPRSSRIAELNALRSLYIDNRDDFNSARTGTLLAAEYIAEGDYQSAENVSREILQVFNELGDEHGIRVARLNLAAALSGIKGREEEAAGIAQDMQQEVVPEEYPRERAALCNHLTRYYRGSGDPVRAAEFALEAIQIGERLQDQNVIAINRIMLGNLRRDEGNLDQALIEYHAAELAAVGAGLRESEAWTNEVIASVHNEREEYDRALHHAKHAAAVARLVSDHSLIGRAEEEQAIALEGLRDFDAAIRAYTDAAKAISASCPGGSYFVSLTSRALHLCTTSRNIRAKVRLLRHLFVPEIDAVDKHINPLHVLFRALPQMANTIERGDLLLPIVALSITDLLAEAPPLVERRIILQATDALLSGGPPLPTTNRLAGVAAVLMAQSGKSLTLGDVADIADQLSTSSARIYFKPQPDGGGHWTIRLEIGGGVIISLVQLDDSPRTATITATIALLLLGFDSIIRHRLLDADRIPRREAIINVVSRAGLEVRINPEVLNLGDMPEGFAVAESTNVTRSDQPPIVAVCADQFPTSWRPHEHALSDLHLLLGELLRILVSHLLAKAVEPDVLFPKIGSVIQSIGYHGPALHAHPRVEL